MTTVFVTGATGVLGRATIPQLLASGYTVRALSRGEANDAAIRAEGAKFLVDAALEAGARVFVYPSFAFVYPDSGDAWIDAASTPVDPIDILHSTISAEREVARFATEGGGRGISLRLGFLYG